MTSFFLASPFMASPASTRANPAETWPPLRVGFYNTSMGCRDWGVTKAGRETESWNRIAHDIVEVAKHCDVVALVEVGGFGRPSDTENCLRRLAVRLEAHPELPEDYTLSGGFGPFAILSNEKRLSMKDPCNKPYCPPTEPPKGETAAEFSDMCGDNFPHSSEASEEVSVSPHLPHSART